MICYKTMIIMTCETPPTDGPHNNTTTTMPVSFTMTYDLDCSSTNFGLSSKAKLRRKNEHSSNVIKAREKMLT